MKAFQSGIIILWKIGVGNTAAEDKGSPYTVLNIFSRSRLGGYKEGWGVAGSGKEADVGISKKKAV